MVMTSESCRLQLEFQRSNIIPLNSFEPGQTAPNTQSAALFARL